MRELVVYGFTVLGEVAVPYHRETKPQSIFVGEMPKEGVLAVDGTKAAKAVEVPDEIGIEEERGEEERG